MYVQAIVGQDLIQWRKPLRKITNTISSKKEAGGGVLREAMNLIT